MGINLNVKIKFEFELTNCAHHICIYHPLLRHSSLYFFSLYVGYFEVVASCFRLFMLIENVEHNRLLFVPLNEPICSVFCSRCSSPPSPTSLCCFIIDPYTSRDRLQLHFAAAVDSAKSPHSALDFNFDRSFDFLFLFFCCLISSHTCEFVTRRALWFWRHGESFV